MRICASFNTAVLSGFNFWEYLMYLRADWFLSLICQSINGFGASSFLALKTWRRLRGRPGNRHPFWATS